MAKSKSQSPLKDKLNSIFKPFMASSTRNGLQSFGSWLRFLVQEMGKASVDQYPPGTTDEDFSRILENGDYFSAKRLSRGLDQWDQERGAKDRHPFSLMLDDFEADDNNADVILQAYNEAYPGGNSEDIDWRPNETIPEDYYSYAKQLYAPAGGVRIGHDVYQGGQPIPDDVASSYADELNQHGAHTDEKLAERDFRDRPGFKKKEREKGAETPWIDRPNNPDSVDQPDNVSELAGSYPSNYPEREGSDPDSARTALPSTIVDQLNDEEARSLIQSQAGRLVKLFNSLPSKEALMALSQMGSSARGWYRDTSEALIQMFGLEDSQRFAALLAATSPNNPVSENLRIAASIWYEYSRYLTGMGQPDYNEVPDLLRQWSDSQGRDLTLGGSYNNNIAMALTADQEALGLTGTLGSRQGRGLLSGNKVESFRQNLIGNLDAATHDVWQSYLMGVDQKEFNTIGGYLANTAQLRRVANELTARNPGEEPWTTAEVQETAWSVFRLLAYLGGQSRRSGQTPITGGEAAQAATHEELAGTSSFLSVLFGDSDLAQTARSQLRELGLGPALRRVGRQFQELQEGRAEENTGRLVEGLSDGLEEYVEEIAAPSGLYVSSFRGPASRLSKSGKPLRYSLENDEDTLHDYILEKVNHLAAIKHNWRRTPERDRAAGIFSHLDYLIRSRDVPQDLREAASYIGTVNSDPHFRYFQTLLKHIGGPWVTGDLEEWLNQTAEDMYNDNPEIVRRLFNLNEDGTTREVDWRPTDTIPEDYYSMSASSSAGAGLPVVDHLKYADEINQQDQSWIGVSENKADDLSFDQAYQRSQSADQKVFQETTDELMSQLGFESKSYSSIGDWEDGAEHSVVHTVTGQPDPNLFEYAAAWQGLLGNQRSVLYFVPGSDGKDSTYTIEVDETDANRVRQSLSQHGVPFRTIIPGKKKTKVIIFDEERAWRNNVANFAQEYNAPVRETVGRGQYLGGSTRSAARRAYRDIIERYESGATTGSSAPTGADSPTGAGSPIPS